jgi:cation diffusion facilitator family transporter
MSALTERLIRRFVSRAEQVADQRVRHGYVKLECWTSIVGNLALGTVKLILGLLTGSIALTADAAHTYGDMLSSIVLLVSMWVAASPPDAKHPHGHGRAEALGTLGLAAMLIVTAVEFFHSSFDRLVAPDPERAAAMATFGWVVIPLLILFWAFKEWMARFSADLGRRISSEALLADAQHHRSDALATLLVVLSFVGARLGYPRLDGLFGLSVAGFIGWAGGYMAWAMISRLIGEAPSEELVARIVSAAASVRGVRGIHDVNVHDYGNHKVVSLHIEVARGLGTAQSHALATLVEDSIFRRLGWSAVVHVEVPENASAPSPTPARAVETVLRSLVAAERAVQGFHAVHVFASQRQVSVDLHLTVDNGLPVEECHRIEHRVSDTLREKLGTMSVSIHCEPSRRS